MDPDGNFVILRACLSYCTRDTHCTSSLLVETDPCEVGDHVGRYVRRWVQNLVQHLFAAGLQADKSAGTLDLGQQCRTVFIHFGQRKSKPIKIWNILVSGIGEVAARELPSAFQQMAHRGALSQEMPRRCVPAER